MNFYHRNLSGLAGLGLVLAAGTALADPLDAGFQHPPDSARPETWWHWMNGNLTREGLGADLQAMKDIGLGGATIVNVDCGIPRGNVPFMSPEWRGLFKYTVQEANRLGLELCIENCAGWSSSGGPWNTPENAMQKLVTSEVHVTGPSDYNATFPSPPVTLNTYHDVAVLAFPDTANETVRMRDLSPVVSLSSGEDPGDRLTDGDPHTQVNLPLPKRGQPQFVQLAFRGPFGARSIKLTAGAGLPDCGGTVAVSDDGQAFKTVGKFTFGRKDSAGRLISLGAQPVLARFWRVQFNTVSPKAKVDHLSLAEIDLTPQLVINNLDAKNGLNGNAVLSSPEPDGPAAGAILPQNTIDLTSQLTADGHLHWSVPAGKWIIQRFGYTPTGVLNHPAPKEGEGLECDKFSTAALDAHWDGFMQKILDDIGPLAGKTLNSSLIDSYEVGGQNWSKDFRTEFQKHRGYDPLKYLPAFTGRVVASPAVSERFLWDVRRTIADLFAENYFGHFADLCRQHGLLNAVEPYTGPFESLQSGRTADVVMGEFWSGSQGHPSVKLAASIAHIYGKNIVGAESFTAAPDQGKWQNDPYSLKTLGDLMFCRGLNRCVFHRYASQPWTNRWPGMTMGQWGFHFERTETWWDQGKGWIDYLTHCQYLLQQGYAVADAAYYTGESAPVEMRVGNPALPAGYDYDAINADVLEHRVTVQNGRLTLPNGISYAVLILPPDDTDMSPAVVERLAELVRAGATIVGPRPQHAPGLTDYPKCDATVQKVADGLWGKCDGDTVLENADGQGRVIWGKPLKDVFAELALKPDFEFQGITAPARLAYVHRVAGEADIYFVSNQQRQFAGADCTFRVTGKIPELWHADTGVMEPAPVWSDHDGRTTVRLDLDPAGSVFVIFRQPATGADHVVKAASSGSAGDAVSKLAIQHAVYASIDHAGEMDVTAQLAELAREGQVQLAVDNSAFDRDPAVNHYKELRVSYTLDGKAGQVTVPEGGTLTLPAEATIGLAPAWKPVVGADGAPAVKVWGNEQIELHSAAGKVWQAKATDLPAPVSVSGAWDLSFPPNWGAPASVTLDKLISWTDHSDSGVRYFSGTATYEKDIEISADRLQPGRELWLDLGAVKNFATVSLNGQNLGVLWKPPFRVNVTAAAKTGPNRLQVKVTNLWPNRLIGDEQLPPDREWNGKELKAWPQWLLDGKPSPTGRFTFTTWHHWTKDSPLLESGLLGPVTLRTAETITVQ